MHVNQCDFCKIIIKCMVIHFCDYDFCRRNTTDNFDTSELQNDFLTRNNSERIAMTHTMIESTRKVCS